MASPEDTRQLYRYADIDDPRLDTPTIDTFTRHLQLAWPKIQEAIIAQRVSYDKALDQGDDALFAGQGNSDFIIREAVREDAVYSLVDNTGELVDVLTPELARGVTSPGPVADCAALTLFEESGTCIMVNDEGAVLHKDGTMAITGAEDAGKKDPLFSLLSDGFSRAMHYSLQPHKTTGVPLVLDAAKEHDVIVVQTSQGFVPLLSVLNANHQISQSMVADALAAAALDEQRKQ